MSTTAELFQQGLQCHQTGRIGEAETYYRHVLQSEPRHSDAIHLLGVIAHQVGKNDIAQQLITQAIQINPQIASYHLNLGIVHHALNRPQEAITELTTAITLQPEDAKAYFNLGNIHITQKNTNEAITAYQKAIALNPAYAEALYNLGVAYQLGGQHEEAVISYQQALELSPNHVEAHFNLANLFHTMGRFEDSIRHFKLGLALKPDDADQYNNLGSVQYDAGALDEAIVSFEQVLQLKPDDPQAGLNRALVWILQGKYEEGWPEFTRNKMRTPIQWRDFTAPAWDGSPLTGKRILIVPHSGFGDSFQYLRYIPLLKEQGATVVYECEPELKRVLGNHPSIDVLVERGTDEAQSVSYDTWAYLVCLPGFFNTTLTTVPDATTALSLNKKDKDYQSWQKRLKKDKNLKVGIAWSGNPQHVKHCTRACNLSEFGALSDLPKMTFYGLQKGPASDEAQNPPAGLQFVNLAPEIQDFYDTATIIAGLDLVISVDTAVGHLAGVLGKPIWLILPFNPDYRWMCERTDTPWYPTMTLYRQEQPGDWAGVFQKIHQALKNS